MALFKMITVVILILLIKTLDIARGSLLNQPKFCPAAAWNIYGITFADVNTVGFSPQSIFISKNNTIYVLNQRNDEILIWYNDTIDPSEIILSNFSDSTSIFVADNGDIFINGGRHYSRVDRWISNADRFVTVMEVNTSCYDLFLDNNHTLYCSMIHDHQIVKRWLHHNGTRPIVVAGSGKYGSGSNELNLPAGMFVDDNFDLYVADWGNNRIQCFQLNEVHGITVAGKTSLNVTIELSNPTGVVLDGDKYLFIADRYNERIVGQHSNGFRCVVGCNGRGSQAYKLDLPSTVRFDSYGNMFVADTDNHRIQKFMFIRDSCCKF